MGCEGTRQSVPANQESSIVPLCRCHPSAEILSFLCKAGRDIAGIKCSAHKNDQVPVNGSLLLRATAGASVPSEGGELPNRAELSSREHGNLQRSIHLLVRCVRAPPGPPFSPPQPHTPAWRPHTFALRGGYSQPCTLWTHLRSSGFIATTLKCCVTGTEFSKLRRWKVAPVGHASLAPAMPTSQRLSIHRLTQDKADARWASVPKEDGDDDY